MIETIINYSGWVGALLLAFGGIPQVIKTWKTKKANDLSWLFLLAWFFGGLFLIFYIVGGDILQKNYHIPLYLNYSLNTIVPLYLIYAKKFYKK